MYHIRVEDSFAAAHFITDYNGKCERLHGHNYRVRVFASGPKLGTGGMLIDFGILKKALKEVLHVYDHSHLNELEEFSHGNPSAELIAENIFNRLMVLLPGSPVKRVEVFETEKNLAAYTAD